VTGKAEEKSLFLSFSSQVNSTVAMPTAMLRSAITSVDSFFLFSGSLSRSAACARFL
jgi:hypothetical protein